MATEKKSQRRRPKRNFATKKQAVHITVYDPQGAPVPEAVLAEAAAAVLAIAQKHHLLIATATT